MDEIRFQKEFTMNYQKTTSSAQEFDQNGQLEIWVHTYLIHDGNNQAFSDGLKLFKRTFIGPLKMPLSLFERCCGPEDHMKWQVNAQDFENRVNALIESIQIDHDMPPLIVQYVNNGFELNDGNHRYEAYIRLNYTEVNVIVWITEENDVNAFYSKYNQLFLKLSMLKSINMI